MGNNNLISHIAPLTKNQMYRSLKWKFLVTKSLRILIFICFLNQVGKNVMWCCGASCL